MDIIGKWKVKELHLPTPDGVKVFAPDALPEDENFEDIARIAGCVTEFAPDGIVYTLMNVPEEFIEAARSEGVEFRDGMAIMDTTAWKEQDGKFFYDTKIEGEVLGEAVDSFAEIKVDENGCLLYNMETFLLERA